MTVSDLTFGRKVKKYVTIYCAACDEYFELDCAEIHRHKTNPISCVCPWCETTYSVDRNKLINAIEKNAECTRVISVD